MDVVFLVAVLGEVTDPLTCLTGVRRVLKPGGLLSVTEQPGDTDFVSELEIRSLAERVGFVYDRQYGKGKNFTINLRLPGK